MQRSHVISPTQAELTSVYMAPVDNSDIELELLEKAILQEGFHVASITPLRRGYIIDLYDSESVEALLQKRIRVGSTRLSVSANVFEWNAKALRHSTHPALLRPIRKHAGISDVCAFNRALVTALPLPRRSGELEELVDTIREYVEPNK